jgi:hypothetical protein
MRVACLMLALVRSLPRCSLEVGLDGDEVPLFSVLGLRRDRRTAGNPMLGGCGRVEDRKEGAQTSSHRPAAVLSSGLRSAAATQRSATPGGHRNCKTDAEI